jgi:serine/threonine protein kinase
MVNGCPPFQNNNPNVKDDWWHLIKNKHWDHYWGMFTQVDDGFKDVIQRILTNDSKTRISLPELLAHEWLGQGLASEQDLALEIKKRVDNV